MRVLEDAVYIEAHPSNFNPNTRHSSTVRYIIVHYTGNINDTARNNALYFRSAAIQTSAHFFISGTEIYQSVPLSHAAYAVGLGSRKEPYIRWPSMWKKATNSNTVSVEICGSHDSTEGTEQTKKTAAKLVADLLEYFNLKPSCVYRHYDVTGKRCPGWAVDDPLKWLEFKLQVNNYFYGKGEDDMENNEENYKVFKEFMDRYLKELSAQPATWETDAMQFCEDEKLIVGGRPKSWITRGEIATVLKRLET